MPTPPHKRRVSVARIVHYWTYEGGELVPNPALVLSVDDDGSSIWTHVFFATGFGGHDRRRAPMAPFDAQGVHIPTEGHWTWPLAV